MGKIRTIVQEEIGFMRGIIWTGRLSGIRNQIGDV
jgi:hypothetical protein